MWYAPGTHDAHLYTGMLSGYASFLLRIETCSVDESLSVRGTAWLRVPCSPEEGEKVFKA